jgi:hypothetical protein
VRQSFMTLILEDLLKFSAMQSRKQLRCAPLYPSITNYILLLEYWTDATDRRGDIPGALYIALENAPYGPDVEEAKVKAMSTSDA